MGPTLIFDFDGTIIDSAPAILATYELVLDRHGLTPKRPLGRDMIGPPLPDTLMSVTGIRDPQLVAPLLADFKTLYDTEGVHVTETYDGMPALLRELAAAGHRLYVATNKRIHPTGLLLDMFGLTSCFTGVYALDSQTPPFADKAAMLVALLQQQTLTARDCLYIGDTSHDEAAAASAGIPFVGVGWGYGVGLQQVSAQATVVATADQLAAEIAARAGQ